MKRIILFLTILTMFLNVTAQSSWGILGKAAGQLLESTSKKNDWQTVGKILQKAGDMQYNLDKTKIEPLQNLRLMTLRVQLTIVIKLKRLTQVRTMSQS